MPVRLLLIALACLSFHRSEAYRCKSAFGKKHSRNIDTLHFMQDFLGLLWANMKAGLVPKELDWFLARVEFKTIQDKYDKWLTEKNKKDSLTNRQLFITQYTRDIKKMPAVLDVDGKIRIVDRHHTFYAIFMFLGRASSHSMVVDIVMDYKTINPATGKFWTRKEMLAHMKENNYINIKGKPNPKPDDLSKISDIITLLQNYPTRSFFSMLLRLFPGPGQVLKGSDFTNQFQNRFLRLARKEGIRIFKTELAPFSEANFDRVLELVRSNPKLLQFMLENINPDLKPERRGKVEEIISSALERAILEK